MRGCSTNRFVGKVSKLTDGLFKSYGNFAEWVDFAYWWCCIGKGLCLQPVQQGYRKFETVQYNRIWNPKLSDKTRKILQHFDKVSKYQKMFVHTLQDNLEQYNHPSRLFYC